MVTSTQAREFLSHHGTCMAQDVRDWSGPIELPESVRRFYAEVGPYDIMVSSFGGTVTFPSLKSLWDLQFGYGWWEKTGELIENWPTHWLVIAEREVDPYIFDSKSGHILFAWHGAGDWQDARELYPDLNTMAAAISVVGDIYEDMLEEETEDDEDDEIKPKWRKLAIQRLTELLGNPTQAELVFDIELE